MIPFHIPRPQGCDIQIFYGDSTSGEDSRKSWNKPRGVSHVYMMLIGGGGDGTTTSSGGSGAVTVWYGAAQHVPDFLSIAAVARVTGQTGTSTFVGYLDSGVKLLFAEKGSGGNGGQAMAANFFAASGFFQSVAGQNGTSTGSPAASATTFLSAGGAATGSSPIANYGYGTTGVSNGFFIMQPIIVGKGASPVTNRDSTRAAYGCGGSANNVGSPGLILIASW